MRLINLFYPPVGAFAADADFAGLPRFFALFFGTVWFAAVEGLSLFLVAGLVFVLAAAAFFSRMLSSMAFSDST